MKPPAHCYLVVTKDSKDKKTTKATNEITGAAKRKISQITRKQPQEKRIGLGGERKGRGGEGRGGEERGGVGLWRLELSSEDFF
ncbi:unnamed protein product [Prunus armeniaca]|uniref:Uncharacterized protein n=1 Tax=Prunus armeniaca TaxID=36596 RepID=A0A6J5VQN0_PRUAR|nr:unnamed protein product [Prunus armeniaca]